MCQSQLNWKPGVFVVLGDLMVDEYNTGNVSRISPEAPIPVLKCGKQTRLPGGAANVAFNLVSLGNQVELLGVVGNDEVGRWLIQYLRGSGIGTTGIVVDSNRPTTVKARFGTHQQSILRVDYEEIRPINRDLLEQMETHIRNFIAYRQVHGLLVSDYGKGVIAKNSQHKLLTKLFRDVIEASLLCAADSKKIGSELNIFRGFTFIKPNRVELEKSVGPITLDQKHLELACNKYLKFTGARSVVVTLGAHGMYQYDAKQGTYRAAEPVIVSDVTGAGDTVFAVLMQACRNNLSWRQALLLADAAASIVVQASTKRAITSDELWKRVKEIESSQPPRFVT